LNLRLEDGLDGRAEAGELLQDRRLLLEAVLHLAEHPAARGGGLGDQELMGDFSQDVGGGEALEVPVFDPLNQVTTGRSEGGMGAQVVNERVRVQEHGVAGGQIHERHESSSGKNSGSRASRSRSSAEPVQPMIP
jgi:hypothetical protein